MLGKLSRDFNLLLLCTKTSVNYPRLVVTINTKIWRFLCSLAMIVDKYMIASAIAGRQDIVARGEKKTD